MGVCWNRKIQEGFQQVCRKIETLIERQNHHLWWENVLYSFIDELEINVLDIEGLFWSEIDFIEDYNRILAYRKSQTEGRLAPEVAAGSDE